MSVAIYRVCLLVYNALNHSVIALEFGSLQFKITYNFISSKIFDHIPLLTGIKNYLMWLKTINVPHTPV